MSDDMNNNVETMSLGEKIEELLENDLIAYIFKGLSIVCTIAFGLAAIAFGIGAIFAQPWYLWFLLFVVSGLIAGVCGGFFTYLIEEY